MRRNSISSVLAGLIFMSGIVLLLHGCSKEDKSETAIRHSELAQAKADLKAMLAKNGSTTVVPLQEKISAYYSNTAGVAISRERLLRHGSRPGVQGASITSSCDYSNDPSALLNSYSITFDCIQGFKVAWNYTVSTNNNIVASNPTTPSQITKGKFYIYNGTTVIYSDLNVASSSIIDEGADPSNGGYELYSITFTTGWLPSSDFSASYTTKLGALLVTDCADIEAFPIALQSYSATGYQFPVTQPCSRIDPYYFNHNTAPLRIWGEDPVGTCSGTGYNYPDLQEINFSIDGGGWIGGSTTSSYFSYYLAPTTWTPYPNFATAQMGYVDPYGIFILQLSGLSTGTHSIAIRTRNILYSNPPSSYPGGVWPTPNPGVNCCAGAWSVTTTYSVTY